MEALTLIGMLLIFNPNTEPLSRQAVNLELAYMTLHAVDWGQTRYISKMNCRDFPNNICLGGRTEYNPILGREPMIDQVDKYFFGTALLHYGILKNLPERHRDVFQMITIGLEAGAVSNNMKIGLKVRF